jgi:hypothetical protein
MGAHCSAEAAFEILPPVKLLLTGDYHVTVNERYKLPSGRLRVISPGSTNLRSINEPERKYLFILYDDATLAEELIPSRRKIEAEIRDAIALDEFIGSWPALLENIRNDSAGLPEQIRLPLLWLRYSAEMPEAYSRVADMAGDDAEIFRKELPAGGDGPVIERFERDKAVTHGLIGCLSLLVEADSDDFNALRELLTSPDPAETLADFARKRGVDFET